MARKNRAATIEERQEIEDRVIRDGGVAWTLEDKNGRKFTINDAGERVYLDEEKKKTGSQVRAALKPKRKKGKPAGGATA